MGIFDGLFGPPSPAKFAKLVAARLRAAGVADPIRFDPEGYRLICSGGGDEKEMYLRIAYEEYCRAPRAGRRECLDHFLAAWLDLATCSVPESFEEAKPNLLPRVRERSFYTQTELTFRVQGKTDFSIAYKPLCEHLNVELCYDTPSSISSVTPEQLEKWGVTLDEALAIARENLWKRSNENFEQLAPGLYMSPWHDNHDASRMVLHDLIWQLQVKGDHVVMVPERDVLIVTGTEEENGLLRMAEITSSVLSEAPRATTGVAARLDGKEWVRYMPRPDYPAYKQFRLLEAQTLANDYGQQKEVLESLHAKDGIDIFVASYMATQNDKTGEVCSIASWGEGIDTLLPHTERIMFGRTAGANPKTLGLGRWDRVVEVAGDLMVPQGMYPERYKVTAFPSAEQLEAMGLEQLDQ